MSIFSTLIFSSFFPIVVNDNDDYDGLTVTVVSIGFFVAFIVVNDDFSVAVVAVVFPVFGCFHCFW